MIFWLLFQEGRYCYEGTESLAVRGKISLARKGLDFAKAQIAQGVAMFKAATKGDFSEFEFAEKATINILEVMMRSLTRVNQSGKTLGRNWVTIL